MKRIVICCDGTWNTPDQFDRGKRRPTNVTKTALAVAEQDEQGVRQIVFYDKGVGTNWLKRRIGGLFGFGLSKNIKDAYRFLVAHYNEGDQVFLFGFSRGAFTARSTAGLVRNCGLLRREHGDKFAAAYKLYRRRNDDSKPTKTEARLFRKSYSQEVPIHFIGVWDTVGALGIPLLMLRFLNWRFRFHDVDLSSKVANAFQALAIDERRGPFRPSIWNQQKHAPPEQALEQVWFPGVHSNIGGGYVDTGLSDIAFEWMLQKAQTCGLVFDRNEVPDGIHPNPLGELRNSRKGFYRVLPQCDRPIDDNRYEKANECVHPSALERKEAVQEPQYAPKNLVEYLKNRSSRYPDTHHGFKAGEP